MPCLCFVVLFALFRKREMDVAENDEDPFVFLFSSYGNSVFGISVSVATVFFIIQGVANCL